MAELTVGYVAGLIAAGIFFAQYWCPTWLIYIMAGGLEEKETAATWSVAGRPLQSSYWPEILQTDAVRSYGVRQSVLWWSYFTPIIAALCAIAGIVTPLGLYDDLEPSGIQKVPFAYVKDNSAFGIGTPSRSNLPFSRTCSQLHGMQGPAPCPYSDTIVILSWNGSSYSFDMPYGYNTTVPKIVRDIYSSGTGDVKSTISNYFDIEWRMYTYTRDRFKNNGSTILVGDYRGINSLILENSTRAVEGLLVDSKNGGIGFRNHTLPVGLKHDASWTEDLLFVEPHSVCVNTNLSLEFTVDTNSSATSRQLELVDYGGFFQFNKEYPTLDQENAQNNPNLYARAYKAAWLNNAWSMAFFNVTNPNNSSSGRISFLYINSSSGKRFPLRADSMTDYKAMLLSRQFGSYIPFSDFAYPNPFNITTRSFENVALSCAGASSVDIANGTNIYVSCGLLTTVPRRLNPRSPMVREDGSKWGVSLYSCASGVRAGIKTVSFALNGTSGLSSLFVTKVERKRYSNNASMPLWGVEDSGLTYDGISPMWGMIDSAYERQPNITSFRKPFLYLPGDSGVIGKKLGQISGGDIQYMPGSDFAPAVMNTVFTLRAASTLASDSTRGLFTDYSGAGNMAMNLRWANLSATSEGAAHIINLIWTDLAASAVVGTKGVLGSGNAGQTNEVVEMTVRPIVRKIKYRIAYAVPAFILGICLVLVTAGALISGIRGKPSREKLRIQLRQSSVGRVFTTVLFPGTSNFAIPSKEWSKINGKIEIDLSASSHFLKPDSGEEEGGVPATENDEGSPESEDQAQPQQPDLNPEFDGETEMNERPEHRNTQN
ncbi:hypothetical protein K469DRAFT_659932 [Zopfia rhizophila CBS 207.26]|uniref:Uncharacterized protein n=1 Tax=Zopfia rhizophila CBS 207.26 TaxID=1314779 RepID=A0A6A6EFU8_9PEZI|nr:hypothetical protein K469DRAFT_659932 [Zopfia rhizophila CBS 207.26]